MWRYSFQERRCLIPVTGFCEAEGEKGSKTRTWFSLPDEEVFAIAGLWRDTPEWGLAYTMVMTEACIHVADIHDRMPVILKRSDWADWLDGTVLRTDMLWESFWAAIRARPFLLLCVPQLLDWQVQSRERHSRRNFAELGLFATILGVLWLNGNANGHSTFLVLPQLLDWFLFFCLAAVLMLNLLRTSLGPAHAKGAA